MTMAIHSATRHQRGSFAKPEYSMNTNTKLSMALGRLAALISANAEMAVSASHKLGNVEKRETLFGDLL